MKTVGSFEAKTHLSSLLDEVAKGASILITKRGRPVASLSPVKSNSAGEAPDVIADFRKRFARSLRKFSAEEITKLKDHGRR
jgi:prevent-host-death family protein